MLVLEISTAVGSLVVTASNSRPEAWVRCSMPPNTLRVHTEYVLVKSVGPKYCGLSHEHRDWRICPSLQFHAEIVEVEICRVAMYRPFGQFRRAKSYCHLYGAQGQRQAYFYPLAAMNFEGLDLTTSGRWH
ncbi:uncharacterized protein TNCV_2573051 [Trichonephila clavipes]|nr:uncharacterized protein TNCV_2573051 [Trichonephila clavipes]